MDFKLLSSNIKIRHLDKKGILKIIAKNVHVSMTIRNNLTKHLSNYTQTGCWLTERWHAYR